MMMAEARQAAAEMMMMNRCFAEGEERGIQIGEQRGIQIGELRGIRIGEQRGIAMGEARGIVSTMHDLGCGEADIIARLMLKLGCDRDAAARMVAEY